MTNARPDERRDPSLPADDAATLDAPASNDTSTGADADANPISGDAERTVVTDAGTVETLPKGIIAGNPKMQILLIAATFYLILIAMCAVVGILVYRG